MSLFFNPHTNMSSFLSLFNSHKYLSSFTLFFCVGVSSNSKRAKTHCLAAPSLCISQRCSMCKVNNGCPITMAMFGENPICKACIEEFSLFCKTKGCLAVITMSVEEIANIDRDRPISRRCQQCASRPWYQCGGCQSRESASIKK
jgi:hypothetical protein